MIQFIKLLNQYINIFWITNISIIRYNDKGHHCKVYRIELINKESIELRVYDYDENSPYNKEAREIANNIEKLLSENLYS